MEKAKAPQNSLELQVIVKSGSQELFKKGFSSFPLVFGRSEQCDISFPQLQVLSRNHGVISIDRGRIKVTDLGSKNGIIYNDQKNSDFYLISGENFSVGEISFTLQLIQRGTGVSPQQNVKTADSGAKVDREGNEKEQFTVEWDPEVERQSKDNLSLQCIITWGEEIYDVRNFSLGDEISIGPKHDDAVYLPTLNRPIKLGYFTDQYANIFLHKNIPYRFKKRNKELSLDEQIENKSIADTGRHYQLKVTPSDTFSFDIGGGLKLHLKYVTVPRPLIKRNWIENKEEFQKAISASGILHLLFAFLAIMAVPQSEAPKIESVPPRFAKLLVEPPKQILAPPPPIELPTPPEPEPPKEEPIVEEKKPEPLKMIVKPERHKPRPKPKPVEKKVAKQQPVKEKVEAQQAEVKEPEVIAKPPAATKESPQVQQQKAAEKAQEDMANIFSALPGAGGGAPVPTNLKVQKGGSTGPGTGGGIKTSGMVAKLNNQGSMEKLLDRGSGPDIAAEAGKADYSQKGLSGKAGKRNIEGAVVGKPQFKSAAGKQGLTNEQVMKVVNAKLVEIHRCYERALFENSSLSGRIEYEWEISPSGSVSSVRVKRSEVASADSLNGCVMAVFRNMKFPTSKNGESTLANIGFPFGKN